MPRVPRRRQWTDAACYHLLNRGHNREAVFADDADRDHFLRLLGRYRDRFGLRLRKMVSVHFSAVAKARKNELTPFFFSASEGELAALRWPVRLVCEYLSCRGNIPFRRSGGARLSEHSLRA